MKKILIIYNVIFLLFGNVLFSSIHYLHDHNHSHDNVVHKNHECDECTIIKNNNNYISDVDEVNFSNNNFDEYVASYISTSYFNINKSCSARAPPFSL